MNVWTPLHGTDHPGCDVIDLRRRTSWTAEDLMAATFPAPRFAVPGVVTEGLNLWAGAPKLGKSWMALSTSIAVAAGGKALGTIDVERGEALYLALEDSPGRLQRRLEMLLEGDPPPSGLTFETSWPMMHDGGADQLHDRLSRHDTRVVFIDVLAKVRGTTTDRESRYETDYRALSTIKAVADETSTAIVVVHHVRKQASEDYLDTVSGTNGIVGACDTIGVLARSRGSADATFSLTGRDIEEAKLALKLVAGVWTLLDGPASDYDKSDSRRRILAALREQEGLGPKGIADASGVDPNVVKQLVRKMIEADELDTDGSGHYFAPEVER